VNGRGVVIESGLRATSRASRIRVVIALGVVAAGYFLQDPVLDVPYHAAQRMLGIVPSPVPHTLLCSALNLLFVLRLSWWVVVTGLVVWIDRTGIVEVLRCDRRQVDYFLKGLAIGLAVMMAAILGIVAFGDAQLHASPGSFAAHVGYGAAWVAGMIVVSAAEEVLFRCLILILMARLFGMRVALVASALAFSLVHVANPEASAIWMVRLFAAGLLLAYSVFRSGTIWWGIGYHAGWNLASAPLFGAAGSGYILQGRIFTFVPAGSALITGGAVGPEGSVLAFVAVVVATVLLLLTVPSPNGDVFPH
jgi:membrane protease YdiL (CAAX protease family)